MGESQQSDVTIAANVVFAKEKKKKKIKMKCHVQPKYQKPSQRKYQGK